MVGDKSEGITGRTGMASRPRGGRRSSLIPHPLPGARMSVGLRVRLRPIDFFCSLCVRGRLVGVNAGADRGRLSGWGGGGQPMEIVKPP